MPIRSKTGTTHDGAPLALAREPAKDIEPWFYWISVAEGDIAADTTVSCRMLGDQACMRLLWGGTWTAETLDGVQTFVPGDEGITLYFGTQTRAMPISVTGSYKVVTIHLTTGAPPVLGGPSQAALTDRIVIHEDLVGHGHLTSKVPTQAPYEDWIVAVEMQLRRFLATTSRKLPDPISVGFERECLASPDFIIGDFADALGVSCRTVERTIKRDFGISPKLVQRRARALDMAATLLGVARPEDEPEARLRYFDQSHLIREIRRFFGIRPGELVNGAHPFLRMTIETRQRRRLKALEELEAIEASGVAPWRDPVAEPEGFGRAK
ncbi:helix-turn-helix domain-containing protein [Qipengyuania sp. XHP0207]|uniref:helix-turn-helix transcriptional regulator n=1 Tax=Qipengyuania sp. XHP0207 TaxID=3038078 RepID=UPI00241F97BB|nr:helix-turn-helix domain-containing protein [Qipengyuania sp. XHP0207]MDG5748204.1 helix-turn-helix domain-containing protein [Qipengyuania sp. XHP0207]